MRYSRTLNASSSSIKTAKKNRHGARSSSTANTTLILFPGFYCFLYRFLCSSLFFECFRQATNLLGRIFIQSSPMFHRSTRSFSVLLILQLRIFSSRLLRGLHNLFRESCSFHRRRPCQKRKRTISSRLCRNKCDMSCRFLF